MLNLTAKHFTLCAICVAIISTIAYLSPEVYNGTICPIVNNTTKVGLDCNPNQPNKISKKKLYAKMRNLEHNLLDDPVKRQLSSDELFAILIYTDPVWKKYMDAAKTVVENVVNINVDHNDICQGKMMKLEMEQVIGGKRLLTEYREGLLRMKYHRNIVDKVLNESYAVECMALYASVGSVFEEVSQKDIVTKIIGSKQLTDTMLGIARSFSSDGSREFFIEQANEAYDDFTSVGSEDNRGTIDCGDHKFDFIIYWNGLDDSKRDFIALAILPITDFSKSDDKCQVVFETVCTKNRHECATSYKPVISTKIKQGIKNGRFLADNFVHKETLKESHFGIGNSVAFKVNVKCRKSRNDKTQ